MNGRKNDSFNRYFVNSPTAQKTKNSKYYTDLTFYSKLLPDEIRKERYLSHSTNKKKEML